MTEDPIRAALFRAIRQVAPGAEPEGLPGTADLRDELDLDSMDFLNVMLTLHRDLKVDIAERDYPSFFTLDGAVAHLGKLVTERGQ
jgi:acyl carrier protein